MAKVWFFIGSGLLAWGIGAILFSAYPILNDGQETPYPWYSDLGYLALPPFMIIALGILNRTLGLAAPIWGKIAAFVMFLVSVTASLSVNWDGLIDDDLLLKLVSAAYILVDPILLGAIVFMASAFRSGEVGEVWWYVVSGLIIYFLGNQAYTYLVFTEQYATGSPIDISWPLGFGLLALAAVVNRNLLLSHK
ncbi:MAG: hypothetical protein H6970_15795 [Gammaproteobacteria bacterium]|nr:hypothetical protein [Gammaproteobacteria bacterium]MCP5459955.1 hypothetical protein [Gammaproteobacteria bacterium]